jgi:hypothetical protein
MGRRAEGPAQLLNVSAFTMINATQGLGGDAASQMEETLRQKMLKEIATNDHPASIIFKSMTFVPVGPVLTRSPRASKIV